MFIEKTHELGSDRAGVTLADCASVSQQLQRYSKSKGSTTTGWRFPPRASTAA